LPETTVLIAHQLTFLRQGPHGVLLPGGVITLDEIDDARLEHKEPAIDPAAVAQRLFLAPLHTGAITVHGTESSGRLHGRDGGKTAMLAMKRDQFANVDIGNTIAIGEAESFVTQVIPHPAQAPARRGVLSG